VAVATDGNDAARRDGTFAAGVMIGGAADANISPDHFDASSLEPAHGPAYWYAQLSAEQIYTSLLDLETIGLQVSECNPLEDDKIEKLLAEHKSSLGRLAEHLLGELRVEGDTAPALPAEQVAPFYRLLRLRKGRSLLQRLLLSLSLPSDSRLAISSVSLLWHLIAALLAPPGLALFLCQCLEPSTHRTEADARSWDRLRTALTRGVLQARSQGRPGQAQAGCVAALSALRQRHGDIVLLCSLKAGAGLVRVLIDGCAGSYGTVAAELEEVLSVLLEELCAALPELYRTAIPSVGGAAIKHPDGEVLGQQDLWALLISLTEQATLSQKKRIHELIGPFVVKVGQS